jgi:DNA polymerase III subunit delta
MTLDDLDARLSKGEIAPVYLVVGDDDLGRDQAVERLVRLVDEDDRMLNVERFHAAERAGQDPRPGVVVAAARTVPMIGDRRVVVYLHAERLFKVRGKAGDDDADDEGGDDDLEALQEYVANPQPPNVLVIVASSVNRSLRLGKLLTKHAAVVDCRGFEQTVGQPQTALRDAMQFAARAIRAAGKQVDAAAISALVECIGPNIVRLRSSVERLLLYVGDEQAVTAADVRAVVGAPVNLDDWGVTNAIQARDTAAALRAVDLALQNGAVPFMVLGQLGWWVRSKMAQSAPARVAGAVRAMFRADAAMKSGGQPRVVLERLVVELCGPAHAAGRHSGDRGVSGRAHPGAARGAVFTPRSRR